MLLSDLRTDARASARVAARDNAAAAAPLACAVSVFAGLSDPAFDWSTATGWRDVSTLSAATKDPFALHFYDGEHRCAACAPRSLARRLPTHLRPRICLRIRARTVPRFVSRARPLSLVSLCRPDAQFYEGAQR